MTPGVASLLFWLRLFVVFHIAMNRYKRQRLLIALVAVEKQVAEQFASRAKVLQEHPATDSQTTTFGAVQRKSCGRHGAFTEHACQRPASRHDTRAQRVAVLVVVVIVV